MELEYRRGALHLRREIAARCHDSRRQGDSLRLAQKDHDYLRACELREHFARRAQERSWWLREKLRERKPIPFSRTALDRPEDEQERYRKILKRALILFLLLALVMPFLPVPQISRERAEELPPRLAKLLLERQALPPPRSLRHHCRK